MSKYTTEVRFICETAAGLDISEGYNSVNTIIEKALPNVFNFDFPIFDESYRPILEKKILKHYYTREIGLETVGLWKLFLDTKLNEIMPFYNQMYKSQLLEFNPFYDVDLTRDHNLKRQETATQENDSNTRDNTTTNEDTSANTTIDSTVNNVTDTISGNTNKHYDKYSETPQGGLNGVETGTYLTNARIIEDSSNDSNKVTTTGSQNSKTNSSANNTTENNRTINLNATNNKNLNSLDDYIEHVKGKSGSASYASLLKEFRETFLNIDLMIIDELSVLFMNLW